MVSVLRNYSSIERLKGRCTNRLRQESFGRVSWKGGSEGLSVVSEGGDSNKAHLRGDEPPRRPLQCLTDLRADLALAAIRSRSPTKQDRWDGERKTQGARRGELHNPNPRPSLEG